MATKWLDKLLAGIGLQRFANRANTGPGNPSAASMWEWIMAPFSGSMSIDSELRYRLPMLRREARKLAFNNPIISQYLGLLQDNVIGPNGMRLQAQVRNNSGDLNKTINDKIEFGWDDFWQDPWVDGRMTGLQGEQLLVRSMATDGEFFVRYVYSSRFKYGFKLQMLDPDQIDTELNVPRSPGQNEIRMGIEVDEWCKPLAYHCYTSNPYDLNGANKELVRIPADDIIHIFDPERIGQTRGYTWFNTVMGNLKGLDGYVEAAILAARTAACAVPVFKQTGDFSVDEKVKNYQATIKPGVGITLPAGLELQNWDPKHPTTNHAEFIKGSLRFCSAGLNVSYNALANDLENVNYSSIRSGLLIERDGWRTLQRMWIDSFRTPIFRKYIWGGLLTRALVLDSRDPLKFQAAAWIPRGWAWVDPLKDMTSAVLAIENRMGTRTKYLAEQGDDFEEVCDVLAKEEKILSTAGLKMVETAGNTEPTTTANNRQHLRLAVLNLLAEDPEIDAERVASLLRGNRNG